MYDLINQILHDIIGKLHGARLAFEIGDINLVQLGLSQAIDIAILYRSILNMHIDMDILEKINLEKRINCDLKILSHASSENKLPLFLVIGILFITNSRQIKIIDEKNIHAFINFRDNSLWSWLKTKYEVDIPKENSGNIKIA
jgi:hypothetical protein